MIKFNGVRACNTSFRQTSKIVLASFQLGWLKAIDLLGHLQPVDEKRLCVSERTGGPVRGAPAVQRIQTHHAPKFTSSLGRPEHWRTAAGIDGCDAYAQMD
jgi:hypothetical protein